MEHRPKRPRDGATTERLLFARLVAVLDQVTILGDELSGVPSRLSVPADGLSDLAGTLGRLAQRVTDDRQTLAMLRRLLE